MTINKWLISNPFNVAKLVIVVYLVGLFTKDIVVNNVIGKKNVHAIFANPTILAIIVVTAVIAAFIAWVPKAKGSNNQQGNYPSR